MSRITKNLGLTQPELGDRYSPDVFNENLTKIDNRFGILGATMPDVSTQTVKEIIGPADRMTILNATGGRTRRIGYFRIEFETDYDMIVSVSGRLNMAPRRVGTLSPEFRPVGPVNLQSGLTTQGIYACEGMVDPNTGGVFLSHIIPKASTTNTTIPAQTNFHLVSGWYILKGSL